MPAHPSTLGAASGSPTALPRRLFLAGTGLTGLAVLTGAGLTACESSSGESASGQVTWSVWGDPGEVQRQQQFTDDFNQRNPKIRAKLISVPTDSYQTKLLTQLSGNTAPDVFYAKESMMASLIKNESVLDLTERLSSSASQSPPSDFFDDLWGVAKDPGGKIYGVPVDCNPAVIWYNKKVLADAGITRLPAEMFEAGEWNREAFQEMAEKLHAAGKHAAALGNGYTSIYPWMTANGGKLFADGKFVAHQDPKSVDAFAWMRKMIESTMFMYAGSLPQGQGQEPLFMSNNLGFAFAGRWDLPLFKQNKNLEFDIVPYPSHDGKLPSTPVFTAYLVCNKAANDPDAAFTFLTEYVSPKGQEYRLAGTGNAVPSIKGPDNVVLEGNLPEHAKYWLDLREKGYPTPVEQARTPGLSEEISKRVGVVWTSGGDPAAKLAELGQVANQMIADAQGS